jgi:hypothetical protein
MVAVTINRIDVNFVAAPTSIATTQFGDLHCAAAGGAPRVMLSISGDVLTPELDELAGLLELDHSELEIVLRRRPRSPQAIQADIEHSILPEPMTAPGEEPWRVIPQSKKAKKKTADEPETQPEPVTPIEPSTAQLVEEFGSWG